MSGDTRQRVREDQIVNPKAARHGKNPREADICWVAASDPCSGNVLRANHQRLAPRTRVLGIRRGFGVRTASMDFGSDTLPVVA